MNIFNHSGMASLFLGVFLALVPGMGMAEESTSAIPAVSKPAEDGVYVVDFLDYRLAIQLRIEKVWTDYLARYGKQLKRGRTVFSYHVNPDGKVTLVENRDGVANSSILSLAHRAIVEANKEMAPFPASVKLKHPSGYFNQITFAVK